MKLCLNMIVKNEAARIERALASVAPYIDCWAITDTGSTDDTVNIIENFFAVRDIPGEISRAEFENWSQARNIALVEARKLRAIHDFDYILLVDADMELRVHDTDKFLEDRNGPSYDMYQFGGSLKYQNRRLVQAAAPGMYVGVTHEYLDIATAGCIPEGVASFVDHADGANRPDKFKRDIRLLCADLKRDPNNARSMFYLANSYRDAGNNVSALRWYDRRVKAGGWDEEVWQAKVYAAHCMKDLGGEAEFIRRSLDAYNFRPSRPEPMYDVARHFREKPDAQPAALAFAEAVAHLPRSGDSLFVNDWVQQVGIKEEISITSFYVPGKRESGFAVTDRLSIQPGDNAGGGRELARTNMWHYIRPLSDHIKFDWKKIDFDPPEGWVAMNPSIANIRGNVSCNVRCVNYRMDDQGRYLIKATDGTANSENPINTRNFLLNMGADPWSQTRPGYGEVLNPTEFPCEFPLVIGFEDMRLIPRHDELWSSATVRQIHPDGNCEQVLSRIEWYDDDNFIHTNVKRMLRTPRATEKNWAPLPCGNKFMWRPGEVVNDAGETTKKHDTGLASDHISGSSQLIPWGGQYMLGVVHEARSIPGSHLRWYYHRFAKYHANGALIKFSKPFFFNEKGIEFCAGMCWHPDGEHIMISYGFQDKEARIARVHHLDLERFLCQ